MRGLNTVFDLVGEVSGQGYLCESTSAFSKSFMALHPTSAFKICTLWISLFTAGILLVGLIRSVLHSRQSNVIYMGQVRFACLVHGIAASLYVACQNRHLWVFVVL